MNVSPMPRETAITERRVDPGTGTITLTGFVSGPWDNWLSELIHRLNQSSQSLTSKTLVTQAASIAPTPFALPSLSPGLYEVKYHARITQPATTSSSLTVGISYTSGGVSVTQSGAAITGNTTATVQSGSFIAYVDQASPLSYTTTYASVGGTPMQYELVLTVAAL